LRGIEAPCQGFPRRIKNARQPLCTESDDDGHAVAKKEAKNGDQTLRNVTQILA
jgi:hypothetical protein